MIKNGEPPNPALCHFWQTRGVFSKVVLGFRNFGYLFCEVGGYVWRWLCRHVCQKFSAQVNVGPSGRSSIHRPGMRTPIGVSGNCLLACLSHSLSHFVTTCLSLSKIFTPFLTLSQHALAPLVLTKPVLFSLSIFFTGCFGFFWPFLLLCPVPLDFWCDWHDKQGINAFSLSIQISEMQKLLNFPFHQKCQETWSPYKISD